MVEFKLPHLQRYQTPTFYRLIDSEPRQPRFRLLKDAPGDGTVVMSEVGGGRVPKLQVENRTDSAVLMWRSAVSNTESRRERSTVSSSWSCHCSVDASRPV
jgi:hypothetical protein